jgi:hypothetical protein
VTYEWRQALEVGLVNQVVPLGLLQDTVQKPGETIAGNVPLSVAAGKLTVGLIAEDFLSDAFLEAKNP